MHVYYTYIRNYTFYEPKIKQLLEYTYVAKYTLPVRSDDSFVLLLAAVAN